MILRGKSNFWRGLVEEKTYQTEDWQILNLSLCTRKP